MTLRVEEINQWQKFPYQEWDCLVKTTSRHSVFLTSAWLTAAWEFLQPGRKLRIFLVSDNAKLVGGLVLAEEVERWRGWPVRKLVLLTDPVITSVRSDLVAPVNPEACADALKDYLLRHSRSWDVLHFDSLPATSPLLNVADFNHSGTAEKHWVLHRLEMENSWDEFMASHSRHLREHLRRERTKLEKLGHLQTEFAETPEAVAAAFEIFFSIEAASGKQERGDYTKLEGRLKDYYSTLFKNLMHSSHALIAILRLEGEPIACILAAQMNKVIYTLNDVYVIQFSKQYAGHYLRGEMIRFAYSKEYLAVDFNGYGSHIQRWRTTGQPYYRMIVFSPSWYGTWLSLYKRRLVPIARRLLPSRFLAETVPTTRVGDRGLEDIADAGSGPV